MAKDGMPSLSVRTLLVELIFLLGAQCGVSLQMLTPWPKVNHFPSNQQMGSYKDHHDNFQHLFPDWLGVELQSIRAQLVLKEYDCLVGLHTHFGRGTCQKEVMGILGPGYLAKTAPEMPATTLTGVRRQTVAAPQASGPARGSQEMDLITFSDWGFHASASLHDWTSESRLRGLVSSSESASLALCFSSGQKPFPSKLPASLEVWVVIFLRPVDLPCEAWLFTGTLTPSRASNCNTFQSLGRLANILLLQKIPSVDLNLAWQSHFKLFFFFYLLTIKDLLFIFFGVCPLHSWRKDKDQLRDRGQEGVSIHLSF